MYFFEPLVLCLLLFLLPAIRADNLRSFAGILTNYSAVYQREATEWFVIAWNSSAQRSFAHPLADGDPKPYCLVPHSIAADVIVDKFPRGEVLPPFGHPSKYSLRDYRQMRNMTRDERVIVKLHKLDWTLQNVNVIDVWGGTLVTWRLRDDHRRDKVMYSFTDRSTGTWPSLMQGDWIEYRNESRLDHHWPFVGEDMRILVSSTSKKVWATWASPIGHKHTHQYFGELLLPPGSSGDNYKSAKGTSIYTTFPPTCLTSSHEATPRAEKNWVPFEYNGTLLFLSRIHPMRTVMALPSKDILRDNGIHRVSHTVTVSLTASKNFCWSWGEMRGGTPAIKVGNEYFAIFHSVQFMASHLVRTYFIGAYTFSSEPPFRMLRMSKRPIVPDFPEDFVYPDIDYVPYPMSVSLDDKYVNVSMGWQEAEGWILTLDRKLLFAGLRNVTSVVLGETLEKDWSMGIPHESFEYVHTSKICEELSWPGNFNCAVL